MNDKDCPNPESLTTEHSADLETEDVEMQEELQRIGIATGLVAVVMKPHVSEIISFGSSRILLPTSILTNFLEKGVLDAEIMTFGMRQTIEKLRPLGSTILLGESLLSLSRASRMYESPEARYELIMEAIKAFREIKAIKRMGRAYLDLGTALKDGQQLYDALRAFEMSTEICEAQNDKGGLAANYYHHAHVCRLLGQEFEALKLLDKADNSLPDNSSAESWRKQILTERIFNNLQLQRDSEALKYTEEWINSGDKHYFPYFYRGEIRERSEDYDNALIDYCMASLALSQDILKNKTNQFRRIDRNRNDLMFQRGLHLALKLDKPEIALALLQVANTGGIGISVNEKKIQDTSVADSISKLRERASYLSLEATEAILQRHLDQLSEYNYMADSLISEQELLLAGDLTLNFEADDLTLLSSRIKAAVPKNAALIEFITVDDDLWLISVTDESIKAHKSLFKSFDLFILSSSFDRECDGRFELNALTAISNELLIHIESILQTKDSLIIVSCPELYGIPFQAMKWKGEPLIETHEISYITSSLNLIYNKQSVTSEPIISSSPCVFIGTPNIAYSKVPDLPGVREEIESINQAFTSVTLRVELPGNSHDLLSLNFTPRLLHVACHGQFESSAPLLSRLLMEDRPVFAFEIMMSKLNVDVVVISACQTAKGAVGVGNYAQSLSSAFLKAGAKNVIAAFWSVDDNAGSQFIKEFYRILVKGVSPITALHIAQRSLRNQPEFSHPYFWAPFTIFGATN